MKLQCRVPIPPIKLNKRDLQVEGVPFFISWNPVEEVVNKKRPRRTRDSPLPSTRKQEISDNLLQQPLHSLNRLSLSPVRHENFPFFGIQGETKVFTESYTEILFLSLPLNIPVNL